MINFCSLPRELRDQIYELCLLSPHCLLRPSRHKFGARFDDRISSSELALGLFRVSKVVSDESLTMFYCRNTLDLTNFTYYDDLNSFLVNLGRNTLLITHIIIDFPRIDNLDPGDTDLDFYSIGILDGIKRHCNNLKHLTTSIWRSDAEESRSNSVEHPKLVTEALDLVDAQFKAIPSLTRVFVELYENGPDYTRLLMESRGWEIIGKKQIQIWSYDEDHARNYRYGWDAHLEDDFNEEWDIDIDSDWWP